VSVLERLRWLLPGGHVFSSVVLVALASAKLAARELPFAAVLPQGVTALSRLVKASGSAELDGGATFLQYELYYEPGRANYEVIRYRLTGWHWDPAGPYSSNERLQWNPTQNDLRRYECEPVAGSGCRWRELDKTRPEYARELQVVVWVLNLHRRLLFERENGRVTP
jgi:hypothetical protein